jgi:hypothetical protein
MRYPQRHLVREVVRLLLAPCGTCACVSLLGSTRFHNAHMLAFDTFPVSCTCIRSCSSLYFLEYARIFEDAALS